MSAPQSDNNGSLRYDFQTELNKFETELMLQDNPHRIGVTIQIEQEQQDEHAPTRGGNPYLARKDLAMNCFCRLVVDSVIRRRSCDKLEEKLKARSKSYTTPQPHCCRCHMGVSNFIFPHRRETIVQNQGGIDASDEKLNKVQWYIFVGQVLVRSENGNGIEERIAGAIAITDPTVDEKDYIQPFRFINNPEHFRSGPTYSALSPMHGKRLSELYGTDKHEDTNAKAAIGNCTVTEIEAFVVKVKQKFDEWLKKQIDSNKEAFIKGLEAFQASQTVYHAIHKLSDVIAYLHRWEQIAPIALQESADDGGNMRRLRERLQILLRGLEALKADKVAPTFKTLKDLHKFLDRFEDPHDPLFSWYSDLKYLFVGLHADLTALAVELKKTEKTLEKASDAALNEWTRVINLEYPAKNSWEFWFMLRRWLCQHPAALAVASSTLWIIFTGVLINILTDSNAVSLWLFVVLLTALIGAALAEVLKGGLQEFQPPPDLNYYGDESASGQKERNLRRSFAADLFLASVPGYRFPLFAFLSVLSVVLVGGILVVKQFLPKEPTTGQQAESGDRPLLTKPPIGEPAKVQNNAAKIEPDATPEVSKVQPGEAPMPKEKSTQP